MKSNWGYPGNYIQRWLENILHMVHFIEFKQHRVLTNVTDGR